MVEVMTKELEDKTANLDKRLSVWERTTETMQSKMDELSQDVKKLTETVQKIELKIAYSAGGFAVAVILAQIILQILMQGMVK